MNEIDIERCLPSPRDRAYGTFFRTKEWSHLKSGEADRIREWEKGALAGAIMSAIFSLLTVTSFVDCSVCSYTAFLEIIFKGVALGNNIEMLSQYGI